MEKSPRARGPPHTVKRGILVKPGILKGVPKDLRIMLQEADAQNFEVARTKNGHIRVTAPNGLCTVTASTPSDPRSIMNSRAELKRLGVSLGREKKGKRKSI